MRFRPPSLRSRRRPLKTISVLPTIVTLGNLLAGIVALAALLDAAGASSPAQREALWAKAAWMVFLGMFCDALDGRVARLTRSTTAFGAQLDSLADVVTFGVVPALLARSLLVVSFPSVMSRLLTGLVVVYVVGAVLRLARYNVESARVSVEGENHITHVFRGIPSPAAAGVVATLVLLRREYDLHSLDWAVLVSAPALGLLMVSRLPYPHLVNRLLGGTRPLPIVVLLGVTVFLLITYTLETVAAAFLLYTASGVVLHLLARWTGKPSWVIEEDQDEALATDSPEPNAGDDDRWSERRGVPSDSLDD